MMVQRQGGTALPAKLGGAVLSGSDLGHASINEQFDAIDIARLVGGKKQHYFGDFFGLAHAAERHLPSREIE